MADGADASLREKHALLSPYLNERQRRLVAAADAQMLGHGGIATLSRITGLSRTTLHKGLQELKGNRTPPERVRRAGGGRKRKAEQTPEVVKALEQLVDPATRGDPMSPLRWTSKSTVKRSEELRHQGFAISAGTVASLLQEQDYSLQSNRKTREGTSHPDRDVQFQHISRQTQAFQQRGAPVISVDTKKKELVGDFRNGGREWQPKGKPEQVRVHDFPDKELGKAIPYGVYEVTRNQGWVSVGTDHDTAEFAMETIRRWWRQMGSKAYPDARELLVLADGGGSNGSRTKLWKVALQRLAAETGCHCCGVSLPTWHQQVEQDRASDVLPHHGKLARQTTRESRGHRQSDWEHHNQNGIAHSSRPGPPKLSNGHQGFGTGFGGTESGEVGIPR